MDLITLKESRTVTLCCAFSFPQTGHSYMAAEQRYFSTLWFNGYANSLALCSSWRRSENLCFSTFLSWTCAITASCMKVLYPFGRSGFPLRAGEGFQKGLWFFFCFLFCNPRVSVLENVELPSTFSPYGKGQADFLEQASSVSSMWEMEGKGL